MADDLDVRLRHLETQTALIDQKIDTLNTAFNAHASEVKKTMDKRDNATTWFLRALFVPFIVAAAAWVMSGGLNK